MTIRFLCPLGHPLAVPDNRAGKKGRCPVCRQRVYVPRPPGGSSLSDDDVAELLADPGADEEEDVEVAADDDSTEAPAPLPKSTPVKKPRLEKPSPIAPSKAKAPGATASHEAASRETEPSADHSHAPDAGPRGSRQRLEDLVGEWTWRAKLWLEPGTEPTTSIGSAEAKWTMDERFVQIESQGTLGGGSFRSQMILGYDEAKQAYTSCYLDNRSTGFFLAEGQADAAGTLRLFGGMHGWQPDEHSRACLYVLGLVHHAKWTLELHDLLRGEKIVEIVHARKW